LIYLLKFKIFIRNNVSFIQEINRKVLQNVAALPFQDIAIIKCRRASFPRNCNYKITAAKKFRKIYVHTY